MTELTHQLSRPGPPCFCADIWVFNPIQISYIAQGELLSQGMNILACVIQLNSEKKAFYVTSCLTKLMKKYTLHLRSLRIFIVPFWFWTIVCKLNINPGETTIFTVLYICYYSLSAPRDSLHVGNVNTVKSGGNFNSCSILIFVLPNNSAQ